MTLVPTEDYRACVLMGKASMYPYFAENGIEWDLDERLKIYSALEIFEIIGKAGFIGYLALRENDGKFYLADLQILEKHRNKGYGTILLKKTATLAKDRGYDAVFLRVFKTSPAMNLYLRNGYRKVVEEKYVYLLSTNT